MAWIDITQLCKSASASLSFANPMISVPEFSLLEAMSAVELMDPKMDQCCGVTGSISMVDLLTISIPAEITEEVVLKLFQSLFILELGFLDGASLLESTHHCVLMWPESWRLCSGLDSRLGAISLTYCKILHHGLHAVNKFILDADIYEDEDFQPLSSLQLQPCTSDEIDFAGSFAINDDPVGLLLRCRVMQSNFFVLLEQFISNSVRHVTSSSSPTVGQCKGSAEQLRGILAQISAGIDRGDFSGVERWKDAKIDLFFNDVLVKRSQNTPVRTIHFRSFADSVHAMSVYCDQIILVCNLAGDWAKRPIDFESLLHYAVDLSNSKLHLVPRSFFFAMMKLHCPDVGNGVVTSLQRKSFPEQLLSMDIMRERWVDILAKVCWETLRTLCVHRNKLLPRLDGILNSWGILSAEAAFVDSQYRQNLGEDDESQQWCSLWCVCQTTLLMDLHLGLSMEMEIISPPEIDYFYWYWDYICSTRIWVMEKLRALQQSAANSQHAVVMKSKSSKKSKKPNLSNPAPKSYLAGAEELFVKARGQICRGQFRMMVAFSELGVPSVVKIENPHCSWKWRFEQRFRAFQSIPNPPPLTFEDYSRTVSSGRSSGPADNVTALTIVENAGICFNNAKKYLDFIRKNVEISDSCDDIGVPTAAEVSLVASLVWDKISKQNSSIFFKVSVANSIASIRVAQPSVPGGRASLSLNRSHNAQFPVLELKHI